MLPDHDEGGFVLCRKLRDAGDFTPVLMLTARTPLDDKAAGFGEGVDDYRLKPFEWRELDLRLRALARRVHMHTVRSAIDLPGLPPLLHTPRGGGLSVESA